MGDVGTLQQVGIVLGTAAATLLGRLAVEQRRKRKAAGDEDPDLHEAIRAHLAQHHGPEQVRWRESVDRRFHDVRDRQHQMLTQQERTAIQVEALKAKGEDTDRRIEKLGDRIEARLDKMTERFEEKLDDIAQGRRA